jgi:phytoene desaturase
MNSRGKIAIIGAGLGGLSAASYLSNSGFEVDVFEQNSSPGGKADSLETGGFRFDMGPSLLTMPFVLQNIFLKCGKNIEDYLAIKPLEIICKYFYPDGTIINAYSNPDHFSNEVEAKTNESKYTTLNYLGYCKTIYDLTSEIFLFGNPSNPSTYLNAKAAGTLFKINRIDPFRTMHEANLSFFKDKRIIQLFDRYATYTGSNPFTAPATLNIIQHVEYNLGAFVSEGGIYSIIKALQKLCEEDGTSFHFNSKVESILIKNDQAEGIEVNGKKLMYDSVVSNADINFTYRNLLKDTSSPAALRYSKMEPSLSGLVFYWGLMGVHPDLEIHNILFSDDYKKEFDDIFEKKVCPDDPTVYIYISSKFNQTDAPNGHENWFVMINAPFLNEQNWDEEILRSRKNILKKIKEFLQIDLKDKIISEKILTPELIEKKTGSFKGSIYGISSNNKMSAFLRHPNKSKKYKGLYFCGGSAHPGGGIPLTLLSGKLAAEQILKDLT